MNVTYHTEYWPELEAAALWYRAQNPAAALGFVSAVEHTVRSIVEAPYAHQLIDDAGIRRAAVWRYPYGVMYAPKEDVILVLAVAHARRRRGYWRTRI